MLAALQFPTWISPEIIPGLPLRWPGRLYDGARHSAVSLAG